MHATRVAACANCGTAAVGARPPPGGSAGRRTSARAARSRRLSTAATPPLVENSRCHSAPAPRDSSAAGRSSAMSARMMYAVASEWVCSAAGAQGRRAGVGGGASGRPRIADQGVRSPSATQSSTAWAVGSAVDSRPHAATTASPCDGVGTPSGATDPSRSSSGATASALPINRVAHGAAFAKLRSTGPAFARLAMASASRRPDARALRTAACSRAAARQGASGNR